MYKDVTIIRGWWGHLNLFDDKYKKQILQPGNNFTQSVYVYGDSNKHFLDEHGFKNKTFLMGTEPFDYRLASNHTLYDHRSLLHKLKILQKALEHNESVLFLDWDMQFKKAFDDDFYDTLKGSQFQVPLYLYPKTEIEALVGTYDDRKYFLFFTKLNDYLKQNAWVYEDSYVIPNTGFIYCNDIKVADELMKIALKEQLTTVPDELAVLFYMKKFGYTLEDYIKNIEPSVISGKDCGNDSWNAKGKLLENYIETIKEQKKNIYLEHV
jgi:hypothetical protein